MSNAVAEELTDNLTVEYSPVGGGKMRLKAIYNGDTLEDSDYPASVFSEPSVRAQFTNAVESGLESRTGVDAAELKQVVVEWCAEMRDVDSTERLETFHTPVVREIVEGTQAVEVHGGEDTTVTVRLNYHGETNELEFTTSEWLASSPGALQEKMFSTFFDMVEVEEEGWAEIRDQWDDQKQVVSVVEETKNDAVAQRVIEYLSSACKPVSEKEDMGNAVEACWFDEGNAAGYDNAPEDAAIVWVQDSFLVDQMEDAGKQVEYKSQLLKDLISRGDTYGERTRRRWVDKRTGFVPFKPDTLGVSESDVAQGSSEHFSEVEI